ncbi:MAG TPA: N-acetylneuraminate synthase [Verrucomicrobia bacterium]|nr:MAG: N-acetylneuraminate synthase [Lentisphaerae bacterium GWF2_57_35]HBA83803.1 N-acetylneuraminate synthase [Verrucomicrobiota bacterium]
MKTIRIGGRTVGEGQPCFIIAEAGVNHNGQLETARALVDAAVWARADAIKFQTFKAERLVTASAPKAAYQKAATGAKETQYEMLKRLELSEKDHRLLLRHCRKQGILFLSSPFDEESADFLESLGVPAFKIGSGELTNTPFLEHVARKKLPIVLSTGMANLAEVGQAVQAIRRAGNKELALLHCVSNYPADPARVNLRAMQTLAKSFKTPVGYSDHTQGIEVAIGAAALGACIVEKHLTLDRNLPGPDHRASIEPKELAAMIYAIRTVQSALGDGRKRPLDSEKNVADVARKSLVAARDIPCGRVVQEADVATRRPGTGLTPSALNRLVGKKATVNIPKGQLLGLAMFSRKTNPV